MEFAEGKNVFCLIYDSNINDYTFFKVYIPGPIPNKERSYYVRDFTIDFISGNKEIFEKRLRTIQNYCYNGYCTALQAFMFETFYQRARWSVWDYYDEDIEKVRRGNYPSRNCGCERPTYPKQGKVFDLQCTEDYFDDDDIKNHETIILQLLDEFISETQLLEEMKAFV